jgi:hypothetical protein
MANVETREAEVAALDKLAAELRARGFEAQLRIPDGWRPSLAVRNPRAPALSETVLAGEEAYWWPWADPIAGMADAGTAADVIARVLAAVPGDGPR